MSLSLSIAAPTVASPLWNWLIWLDRTLKIAISIAIGVVLNYLIRRLICRTTDHIAAGDAAVLTKERPKTEKDG